MTRQSPKSTQQDTKQAAKRKPAAWTYIVGEKGKTRVRLFERHGLIWIDYTTDDGRRVRHSLQHDDRERAKLHADEIVAQFRRAAVRPSAPVSLKSLFEMYEREVTPGKASGTQGHDRRAIRLFLVAFGGSRRPSSLNVRDWSSFITRRRSGALAYEGREGKSVRAQVIAQDCKLLLAILNWAERAGDGHGGYLLDKNPLRGLAVPKEESPIRPMMTPELFDVVRAKSREQSITAELFVCLLWFTGHRAASVRQLMWTDIDLAARKILWRAEVDKINYRHENPMHSDLVPILSKAQAIAELTGETLLFPSPIIRGEPITREGACKLWRRIADAAGISPGSRIGTHSFRRAFANRLRDVNLRDLKDLGGWKTQKTVIDVYLQPDQDAQRSALERFAGSTTDWK